MSVGIIKIAVVTALANLIFSLSCSKLSNKHQDVKLKCGDDVDVGFQYFVKILDSQNRELSPETLSRLKIEAQGPNGPVPFQISSKSCVMLSQENVELSVSADSIQESGIERFSLFDSIENLKLKEFPKVNVRMNCPDNGYFVNNSLKNMLDLSVEGDSRNFLLALRAIEKGTQKSYELFSKAKGVEINLPEAFNTSNLPNGQFQIEVLYGDDFESWRNPRLLGTEAQRCMLTVSHDLPGLKFLEANRNAVPPRALIPWAADDISEIKSCFIDDGEKTNPCSSEDSCGKANVHSGLIEAPEKAGKYRLIVWAQGKNGLESKKTCQNLRVSIGAPNFSVEWRNHDWQDGFASFDIPLSTVSADIDRFDGGKSEADFTCKVDFLSRGKVEVKSPDVLCLSESCKGLSMNNFVPCNENIEFSLTEVWGKRDFRDAYLRLTVRSDDGADHVREKSIVSYMSETALDIVDTEIHKVDTSSTSDHPQDFLPLKNGEIFKPTFDGDYIWNDEKGWSEAYIDGAKFPNRWNVYGSRGFVWTYSYGKNVENFRLLQYRNRQWVTRLESAAPIQFGSRIETDEIAVLVNEQVYLVSGDNLSRFSKFYELPGKCEFDSSVFASKRRIFALCGNQLLEASPTGWEKRAENDYFSYCGLEVDIDGALLCQYYARDFSKVFFAFDEKNDFVPINLPAYINQEYPFLLGRIGVDDDFEGNFYWNRGVGEYRPNNGIVYLDSNDPPYFFMSGWSHLQRVEKVFGEETYFISGKKGHTRALSRVKRNFQLPISNDLLAEVDPIG